MYPITVVLEKQWEILENVRKTVKKTKEISLLFCDGNDKMKLVPWGCYAYFQADDFSRDQE